MPLNELCGMMIRSNASCARRALKKLESRLLAEQQRAGIGREKKADPYGPVDMGDLTFHNWRREDKS